MTLHFRLFIAVVILFSSTTINATEYIEPTLAKGAFAFNQRCTICHGNMGMGYGLLPRVIKDYPNTNLLNKKIPNATPENMRETIVFGGENGFLHELMPPFGDELTWLEIESLVEFMLLYYKNSDKAIELLKQNRITEVANKNKGRAIFQSRCILCHGSNGDGKGKMAKIIKNPLPFDLRISRAPDEYLLKIISKGGKAMARSPKMPAFEEELSISDIGHIIAYIKAFRE